MADRDTGEPTQRPQSPLDYERRLWGRGLSRVAGVDEAGRGPLAGPVVAAAVVLPRGACVEGAADSKLLDPEVREELHDEVLSRALAVGIGAASVREIDRLNILVATARAMRRALEHLSRPPEHVLVDGLPVRDLGWEHEAVVDGDDRVHSIACASIVAKVCRDRLMRKLHARYPGYGWETNMGYATPDHRAALERLGPTPHHRLTFGSLQYEMEL